MDAMNIEDKEKGMEENNVASAKPQKPRAKLNRKLAISTAAVSLAALALVGCVGVASSDSNSNATEGVANVNYNLEGSYRDGVADLVSGINVNLDEENAEKNAPKSYVDRNGFTVQPVPSDDKGWNISYLNADNRGCTSCHTLEDALMMSDTSHGIIFQGYPTEETLAMCITCHIWAEPLRTTIHSTHLGNQLFENEGGTCESCHYIDENGDFKRWDYEKYNLYKGITDLDSDSVDMDLSYDQTTITETEDMFYKSIKSYGDFDESNWRTDDSNMDPELYNNWVFTVDGDCENPISMTLPELVEKFGTITTTMKQQCTINGYGNAAIMQCEVTGVPVKKILEYVKPKGNVNAVQFLTEDPYPGVGTHYNSGLDKVDQEDAVLVLQVNGETLPNTQGYPCSLWLPRGSAAAAYKVCEGFNLIEAEDETTANNGFYLGGFEDAGLDGQPADKPNAGVLNMPTGTVLEGVAGTPVDIEGYADAFDEPITKVEFSWDHGETWTTMETPNNNATYWTYWRMRFTPPSEGAYLLNIRAYSMQSDGTEHAAAIDTQFLLNVK